MARRSARAAATQKAAKNKPAPAVAADTSKPAVPSSAADHLAAELAQLESADPAPVVTPANAANAATEAAAVVDPSAAPVTDPDPASPAPDAVEPAAADPAPAPLVRFGGKGDHDGDGTDGGAAPAIPRMSAEPTLAELNRQAWRIDDEHRAKREAAEVAIEAVAKPLLQGVPRGRARPRRLQKPLRPLVK